MANTAVVFNADGTVLMLVTPDQNMQLNDKAFNPQGTTQVRLGKAVYDGARDMQEAVTACLGVLDARASLLADVIRAKRVRKAEAEAKADEAQRKDSEWAIAFEIENGREPTADDAAARKLDADTKSRI